MHVLFKGLLSQTQRYLYFQNITSTCYYLARLQSLTEFYLYQGNASSKLKKHSYSTEVIASSPSMEIEHTVQAPIVTQLQCSPRPLPARVAAMSQILVHTCTKSILVLGQVLLLIISCLFPLELDLTCDDLKIPEAQILNWIAINIPQNLESYKLFSTYIVA